MSDHTPGTPNGCHNYDPARRSTDVARERQRLEAMADYLGILVLGSVLLFAGKSDAVDLACAGGITSIATVAGWMKHKGVAGSAIVLMLSWPVAKVIAALAAGAARHV